MAAPLRHGFLALAVVLAGLSGSAIAQPDKPQKQKPKNESWVVVEVGDELQVVEASAVKQLKADKDKEFKEAMKAYLEAKKAAQKEKRKLDQPMPKKVNVKTKKAGFKSKEDAEAFKEKAGGGKPKKEDE